MTLARAEDGAFGEDGGSLDDVLQLSDVAGPGVAPVIRSRPRALTPCSGLPSVRAILLRKNPTSSGMSDGRSRSGGTSIGKTFSR